MKSDNERFRKELPPVPVIENWIKVNNEIISLKNIVLFFLQRLCLYYFD